MARQSPIAIAETSDGNNVKIFPFSYQHIWTVHGNDRNSQRQNRKKSPSYFSTACWKSLIMQTLKGGDAINCNSTGSVKKYLKEFSFPVGHNPDCNMDVQKICAIVKRGVLITAFPTS